MKGLIWLVLLLAVTGSVFALNGNIPLSITRTAANLENSGLGGLTVSYNVSDLNYDEIKTPQGVFTDINIADYASTNRVGLPKLPLLRKIIRVPLNAIITPSITAQTNSTIVLADLGLSPRLLPKQPSVAKNVDPASVPFAIDQAFYSGVNWSDDPAVKVEEIGMLRGARLVALDFTPVKYNPQTGELVIISAATVNVSFAGADWAGTDALYQKYYSPAFESVLAASTFNYAPERASLNRYPLGLIIITPASYVSTLQPFVDWKIQSGYAVTVATTATTGTTTTAIKTYLQNIWNNATVTNPAPSYLLLVGDVAQIPAWTGVSDPGHVTDLTYVRLQGTDFVPEMYFGRFSATTVAQVQAYVDKTLQYEMYTMPDPSYLARTDLIAGMDTTYGPTHANGQINYGKTNYFGESLTVPYGPYSILNKMYLYPNSGTSEAAIIADMNAGLGYINYTAHGDVTFWYDPNITASNVINLTNANKYFVAVGNCCLTDAFQNNECFGEAITRYANKGAVAYVGGTNSTFWDEDYYWAVGYKTPIIGAGSPYAANKIGAFDALFHYHGEANTDWAGTMGSMIFMGNLAVTQANSSSISYYWEIYSLMGDPTPIPYMGLPTANQANYSPTLQVGIGTMQILADPYSYVAISQNGSLHGTGMTDGSGALTLAFTPFPDPGTARLVITRSLREPLIADIQVTSNSGPYVVLNTVGINDGNNSIAESGETLYLDLVVNNVGTQTASNITATLSSTSPYVTILDNTASLASLAVNTPVNMTTAFQIAISSSVPDQEAIPLTIHFQDSSNNSWTVERSVTVNAPDLEFAPASFTDPNNNGSFDAGEIVGITVNLTNNGHMNAASGALTIVINSSYGSTDQTTYTLPGINIGVNLPLTFQVTIAANAPLGTSIPIGLALTSGTQLINSMISLPVGAFMEDCETGNFSRFPWINTSATPWTVASGTGIPHDGAYAFKTGAIGSNGTTELSLVWNVSQGGNITFWRRVSSESGYDFFKFFIDASELGSWSGAQSWAQQTYPVTTGTHTFKWVYSKDDNTTGGSDCAWIDDIVFPISAGPSQPFFYLAVPTLTFTAVPLNTPVSQDLVVRNLGATALTGTITVPALVNLSFNGTAVADVYNYSIPAGQNGIFTISILLTSSTTLNDNIVFTSNDTSHPTQQVGLDISSTANDDNHSAPLVNNLEGNYPNPFNPNTTIRFAVKNAGPVAIRIYNSRGQLVRTLVDAGLKAGNHSLVWNGLDDTGKSVASGLYLYKMQTKGFAQTRKMMLMK